MISYRDLMCAIKIVGQRSPSKLNDTLVIRKESTHGEQFTLSYESTKSGEPKFVLAQTQD